MLTNKNINIHKRTKYTGLELGNHFSVASNTHILTQRGIQEGQIDE